MTMFVFVQPDVLILIIVMLLYAALIIGMLRFPIIKTVMQIRKTRKFIHPK
jgi:hypothetical protein